MASDWVDITLEADRWSAFDGELSCVGFDFTGATFAMQVRVTEDAGGDPLIDLGTTGTSTDEGVYLAYAGIDTIANHIAAGRLDEVPEGYESTDSEYLSSVTIHIDETTMESLFFPEEVSDGERGDDLNLAWGLHVTTGGVKKRRASGLFVVAAGAME